MGDFQPIDTAPRNGTTIQARIPGHGDDNMISWIVDGLENEDGPCGAWAFTSDQEPPDCWTDGWCWAVNENNEPSIWPTHWKPFPTSTEPVSGRAMGPDRAMSEPDEPFPQTKG